MAAFVPGDFTLTGAGDPVRLRGKLASEGFFDVLAAQGDQVAVLSYGMWQGHLGGRQDVLGSTLQLSARPSP